MQLGQELVLVGFRHVLITIELESIVDSEG